jgi:dipeptidyl aminopeptidase/acylaminoacyl peptidase
VFDVAARTHTVLTSSEVDDASPSWSPDGKQIAFLSKRAHPSPIAPEPELWPEARAGVQPRQVTSTPGESGGRSGAPTRRIAVLLGDIDKYGAYDQNKLALVPAPTATSAPVARPAIFMSQLDRAVSNVAWSSDGESISFLLEDDRRQQVATVPTARVSTRGVEPLTTSNRRTAISPGKDGHFAVLMTTPTQPPEIYALEGRAFRPLTAHNEALVKEVQLATTEDFQSRSKDGTEVHGLIVKPAGYQAGRRYPMILLIHGGPNGQDEHDFNFQREFLAAQGYVVLAVNYRGSAGRGNAYQKAIYGDWGNLEVVDLLGAVDEAVRQGIADPDRLGIGGWSYGGISTNYTIATDPRFKAAVSGAGSSMQFSMYGLDQYIVQ